MHAARKGRGGRLAGLQPNLPRDEGPPLPRHRDPRWDVGRLEPVQRHLPAGPGTNRRADPVTC